MLHNESQIYGHLGTSLLHVNMGKQALPTLSLCIASWSHVCPPFCWTFHLIINSFGLRKYVLQLSVHYISLSSSCWCWCLCESTASLGATPEFKKCPEIRNKSILNLCRLPEEVHNTITVECKVLYVTMGKSRMKITYPCPVCDKPCGWGTIHCSGCDVGASTVCATNRRWIQWLRTIWSH